MQDKYNHTEVERAAHAHWTASDAYRALWEALRAGQVREDVFLRVTKAGKPLWLQASYNPVRDAEGRAVGVVKLAPTLPKDKILLVNLSKEPVVVLPGDRIAQMVIAPVIQAQVQEVNELSNTARGDGVLCASRRAHQAWRRRRLPGGSGCGGGTPLRRGACRTGGGGLRRANRRPRVLPCAAGT